MNYDTWKTADDPDWNLDAEEEYQLRFIQLLDAGLSDEEADKIARDHAGLK